VPILYGQQMLIYFVLNIMLNMNTCNQLIIIAFINSNLVVVSHSRINQKVEEMIVSYFLMQQTKE